MSDYEEASFQEQVRQFMHACFDPLTVNNREERNDRFLEEALELVQANGMTKHSAHTMVEYVFSRPRGDISQEVGGVCVTLAALCEQAFLSMERCADAELRRSAEHISEIRAKNGTKPRGHWNSRPYLVQEDEYYRKDKD